MPYVAVYSTSDLRLRFLTATATGKEGGFGAVAWAVDPSHPGSTVLHAAGSWSHNGAYSIRSWPSGGKGKPREVTVADNTIFSLKPLASGRVLVGASSAAWGTLETNGKWLLKGLTPAVDARLGRNAFELHISPDGDSVGYAVENGWAHAMRFTLSQRALSLLADTRNPGNLVAPQKTGLKLERKGNGPFLLNDKPLEFPDALRSFAISRDASRFIFGGQQAIYCYNAAGTLLWGHAVPPYAWMTNIAGNRELAVARCGDGTIRWYNISDGQELLVFFPHRDQKRWVLWAPVYKAVSTPMMGVGGKVSGDRLEVVSVEASAKEAGIEVGDVILRMDQKSLTNIEELRARVRQHAVGDRVTVTLQRQGREMDVIVTLAKAPDGERQLIGAYYDCSAGADDLIGWHVNRGKNQEADFFSVNQFRNVYYRPDVIQKVLKTHDVFSALREANRERGVPDTQPEAIAEVIARLAPPVVELESRGPFSSVTLPSEATEIKVRYRVRQTGREAPAKMTVRFNGRLAEVPAPLPGEGQTAEINVPIPAAMAGEITLFAEHRLAVSEPAVLRIERTAGPQPHRPILYLVSAGVAHFGSNRSPSGGGMVKDGSMVLDDIPNSDRDAEHAAAALQKQAGRLYEDVRVTMLTNEKATAPAVREALRKVAREAMPEDVAVIFFSSHGVVEPKLGFYLATSETDPMNAAATALTGQELSILLEAIKARTVLALDTCHSGGALAGARLNKVVSSPNDLTGFINGLASAEQGTVVLSSSAAAEQSLDDPKKGGIFTQAFCEALTSKAAANSDGLLTCGAMQAWLNKRVPELVAKLVKGVPNAPQQTPVCVIPKGVPDFPIARP